MSETVTFEFHDGSRMVMERGLAEQLASQTMTIEVSVGHIIEVNPATPVQRPESVPPA